MPTAPELQASASLGYVLPLGTTRELFATLTLQLIGSSYSQIAHQVPDFSSFVFRQYGGPLTQPTFTFDPELPSYEIGNLRLGSTSPRLG